MRIRKIVQKDEEPVFEMMRIFYDSPALIHKSSDAVLRRDIQACIDAGNPFVEAYVFEEEEGLIGYAMVSKNYTTEYGGLCIWIEDLYFQPEYRHRGYGTQFFSFIEKENPGAIRYKLEVEPENETAVAAYQKNGYAISDYYLMTKEIDRDL